MTFPAIAEKNNRIEMEQELETGKLQCFIGFGNIGRLSEVIVPFHPELKYTRTAKGLLLTTEFPRRAKKRAVMSWSSHIPESPEKQRALLQTILFNRLC